MAFEIGSFNGKVAASKNLIDDFIADEKKKHPGADFKFVRKLAISTNPGTHITVNKAEVTVPEGGVVEFGLGLLNISTLIFKESVVANIVYIF